MTEAVLVLGRTCHLCALYNDRTKDFPTDRGVFQHLLYHRDAGHEVSKELIDRYDPDFDASRLPEHDPERKGRDAKGDTSAWGASYPHGSYGTLKNKQVLPERMGKVRGRKR